MHRGMKRSYRVLAQATCLFVLVTSVWLWSGSVLRDERIVRPVLPQQWKTTPESTSESLTKQREVVGKVTYGMCERLVLICSCN